MSTQKGNSQRTRPQKHQNNFAFKNDLHDKTVKNKMINKLEVSGVCTRCKDIIEWRIRYKQYKPLTVPKKCTRCEGRTILFAYHVLCQTCSQKLGLCAKCSQPEEDISVPTLTAKEKEKEKSDFRLEMKLLPERQRRSLIRSIAKSGNGIEVRHKNLSTNSTTKDKCSDDISKDQFDQCSLNSSFSENNDI